MGKVNVVIPKMGEGVIEATIIKWRKKVNDNVAFDESIADIATDKVDNEITSPVSGKIIEILFAEGQVVAVGSVIAVIESSEELNSNEIQIQPIGSNIEKKENKIIQTEKIVVTDFSTHNNFRTKYFYSPLVKKMAKENNVSLKELDLINISSLNNRFTKHDFLKYLNERNSLSGNAGDTIIKMDRVRRIIAEHMINSIRTSAHVTSFIEIDVTAMVDYRNQYKKQFEAQFNQKFTYTPIFIKCIADTLTEMPLLNASVDGDNIVVKKQINIGMATALENGNLIVPVIKNVANKGITDIALEVNRLANLARNNALSPEDIQQGTFTFTNLGTFGTTAGTPIIYQPQVAILAAGAIKKQPVVIETKQGDVIAIRSMCIVSLSYDHRIIDGALAGKFLQLFDKKIQAIASEFNTKN